jgi:hypothetical protein
MVTCQVRFSTSDNFLGAEKGENSDPKCPVGEAAQGNNKGEEHFILSCVCNENKATSKDVLKDWLKMCLQDKDLKEIIDQESEIEEGKLNECCTLVRFMSGVVLCCVVLCAVKRSHAGTLVQG